MRTVEENDITCQNPSVNAKTASELHDSCATFHSTYIFSLISFYIFSLKCHQPQLNRAAEVNVFATFADSVQKVHGVESVVLIHSFTKLLPRGYQVICK